MYLSLQVIENRHDLSGLIDVASLARDIDTYYLRAVRVCFCQLCFYDRACDVVSECASQGEFDCRAVTPR